MNTILRPRERVLGLAVLLFSALPAWAGIGRQTQADILRKAVETGLIVYRLSEPPEVQTLLGPPARESTRPDGGMLVREWTYEKVAVFFGKMKDDAGPFTLLTALIDGVEMDIGRNRVIVLRSAADLKKMDSFSGLQNVSLARCDLRDQESLLESLPFDNRTQWPPADKLPPGFNPLALLEQGKNPGLGIRALHGEGIDGRGVGIAIIDQPLLPGHREYQHCLVRYHATGLEEFPPQMHGPAVLSIAAGRTCGVAPGAAVTFFAVPMWQDDNAPYVKAMEKIFALNETLPPGGRIRAVSISTGMFRNYPGYEDWKRVQAEAERRRILLISCDLTLIRYGALTRIPGKDADDPAAYLKGRYAAKDDVLLVPAGNRTIAAPSGPDDYTFDREGGMSWGAPYIAGLAALAFQVDPLIKPAAIIELLVATATPSEAGPIVNPREFIAGVRQGRKETL